MQSSTRIGTDPTLGETDYLGFRLATAAVPEPSRAMLLLAGLGAALLRRRRRPSAL